MSLGRSNTLLTGTGFAFALVLEPGSEPETRLQLSKSALSPFGPTKTARPASPPAPPWEPLASQGPGGDVAGWEVPTTPPSPVNQV